MRAMLVIAALIIPGCFPIASETPPKDPAKEELEELSGTWKLISKKVSGLEVIGKYEEEGQLITFNNGEYKWVKGGGPSGKIVSINPSQKPKEVDYLFTGGENKGRTHKAIYKLYVDTFIDCFGPPGSDRPTDFNSNSSNQLTVMIYKRVNK